MFSVVRRTYVIVEDKDYIGSMGGSTGSFQNYVWNFDTIEEALEFAIKLLEEPRFGNPHLKKYAIDLLTHKFMFEHGGEMIMIGMTMENDDYEEYRKNTLH